MNKSFFVIVIFIILLFLNTFSKSRSAGDSNTPNSYTFYQNKVKLTFLYSELDEENNKQITIIKNDNEEIPFFSHFHKNSSFDAMGNRKTILTEKESVYFNDEKIEIPVLTVEYTIEGGSRLWERDEVKITCSKPDITIHIRENFIDSVNTKITDAKYINIAVLPLMEDYKHIMDELFLASLTGNSKAKENLSNLSKFYPMDKSQLDKWLRYISIINKRNDIQS